MQQLRRVPEPSTEAWAAFTGALGLAGADRGQRVTSKPAHPRLAGVVEVGAPAFPELLLRLDQPAPGIAHLFALSMGGRVFLTTRLYLYGEQAAAVIAQEEPKWQAWLATHTAAAGAPGPG